MYEDTALLPEELAAKSLSDCEIILPYNEALQAIAYLNARHVMVFAWEGWISYPDGKKGFSGQHQGTECFFWTPGHPIQERIKEATAFMLCTIQQSQQEWDASPKVAGATLYFCLSVEHVLYVRDSTQYLSFTSPCTCANKGTASGDCVARISILASALAPLMSDLNALSQRDASMLPADRELWYFAELQDTNPLQAAEKSRLKAQLLARLDQLDADLAALQQRSAADFERLYGPYSDSVRESDFLYYKTLADEFIIHVEGHLLQNNTHALFYASQAYLGEMGLRAHVIRRYLEGNLAGPGQQDDVADTDLQATHPIESVRCLIQALEHNTVRHLSQLQQCFEQLSARFERLKAEEAQLALEWAAWQPRLDAIQASHEAFKQKLRRLNIDIGSD